MTKTTEKKRQEHSITVTNLGDGVRVTGGGIPPIVACSLLFEAYVEVSKSFGMSRHDVAEQRVTTPDRSRQWGRTNITAASDLLFANRISAPVCTRAIGRLRLP